MNYYEVMTFEVVFDACLALFAVLNPLGNMPVFLEYTAELDGATRHKLFRITALTAFVTLLVLTFTGRWIMQYVFQISIDEFRLAGGIILTVIATLRIVNPAHSHDVHVGGDVLELGVVPMAIPLLVGPGAIVTSILILDSHGWIVALIALTATLSLTWIILRSAVVLNRLLGKFGSLVVSRIMYIFIAAIGIHFLVTGIARVFHISIG